ncbi:MAG: hypothetical protein IH607_01730, partial [Firmicutes bacterium]|nr:hypothetical protein [Bacillota bacterium]
MVSRLQRVCAIVCVLCLCMGAAAAQESVFAAPVEGMEFGDEQVIDPGILPDAIRKFLDTAIGEIGYTERSDGYSKY